jgi:hypothetical protein
MNGSLGAEKSRSKSAPLRPGVFMTSEDVLAACQDADRGVGHDV